MSSLKYMRMVKSEEAMTEKMSIFTVPPTDICSEGRGYMVVSNKNPPTDNVVLFNFEVGGGYMIVPNEIEMEITGKIKNGDGSDVAAMPTTTWAAATDAATKKTFLKADVFPINNLFMSLFKHARVGIQDQYMDFNDIHFKAMLDATLNVKHGNSEKWLSQMYIEQSGKDGDKYSSITGHAEQNRLGGKLSDRVKKSREFQMRGKLPLDFCKIDKFILSRVPISMEFIANSPETYLMSAFEDAKFKFVMSDCKLYVPIVKVRPDIDLANAETLKRQPALYPYTRSVLKTYTVSSGNHSFEAENLFQWQVPLQTVVCMVSSKDYSPGYKNNPFNIKSFGVNNICLNVDDARHSLTMKFGSPSQTVQPFMALMNMFPFFELSLDEFTSDLPIFVFDTRSSSDENTLPMTRKGFTRLEMKFDDALAENINVFVLSTFGSVMEITDSRSVTL
jgi:hypothetical protein